jgi:hypothetical protein
MASHVGTQCCTDGGQESQKLVASFAGGHCGGRTQQVPSAIGEQWVGPIPPSSAQSWPAAHVTPDGPPQLGVRAGNG